MSGRLSLAEPLRLGRRIRVHRRALLGIGGSLVVAGLASVAFPYGATLVIGAAAAWLLWLVGAVMVGVTLLLGVRRSLWISLLACSVAIAAGAYMLVHPIVGAAAVAVLLAAVLICDGAFELALACDLRPLRAWRWLIASAAASMFAGVALLRIGDSPTALARILGPALATSGAAVLAIASARRGKGRYSAMRRRSRADVWEGASPRTPST